MENSDKTQGNEIQAPFLLFSKKIVESITELWTHDPDEHNCRSIERDRPTWRFNN